MKGRATSAKPDSSNAETAKAETATPVEAPYGPGSAKPQADGSAPSGQYTIKGNSDSMLFHTSASPYYNRTRAEVWFSTESAAEAAGFTRWDRKAKAETPQVEPGPYAGSAKPTSDGAAPSAAYAVKGNEDSKLFHTEASSYYGRTKAEVWFDSEASAEAAGFTRWDRKPKEPEVAEGPYGAGSALPLADGSAPSSAFVIKGNGDSMLFHGPDSPYYNRTKAEVWFDTAERAEAAGFTGWTRKK